MTDPKLEQQDAFDAWFAEYDKQNHYPEMLARAAWQAALSQQRELDENTNRSK